MEKEISLEKGERDKKDKRQDKKNKKKKFKVNKNTLKVNTTKINGVFNLKKSMVEFLLIFIFFKNHDLIRF